MNKFFSWFKLPFKKFAKFAGRSSRSEYWYFFLGCVILSLAFSGFDKIFHTNLHDLWSIISFIPSLSVASRRLHDSNHSALNLLWLIIPILGPLYLLWLLSDRSSQGSNDYGQLDISEQRIYKNMFGKNKEKDFDFNQYH